MTSTAFFFITAFHADSSPRRTRFNSSFVTPTSQYRLRQYAGNGTAGSRNYGTLNFLVSGCACHSGYDSLNWN